MSHRRDKLRLWIILIQFKSHETAVVPEYTEATGAEANQDEDGGSGPMATEDISLVVLGKGLPVTPLTVAWEPRRRRLEVRVPAAVAAALRGGGGGGMV